MAVSNPHGESAWTAQRVLFVIPGGREGHSMLFARRQAETVGSLNETCLTSVEIFYLRSRTSIATLLREWLRFRRVVHRFSPHLIHAHFGTMTAMFVVLGAGRLPMIITYRGGDLNPPPSRARRRSRLRALAGRWLSQLAALRADEIICVSRELRQKLWWKRSHAIILPSGVDTRIFYPDSQIQARARLGWKPDERVVLFNAGCDPLVKRLDLASAAISKLRHRLDAVRFEILDGQRDPAQMPVLMNAADVLLVTSDQEGSPTVVQEALATNLPIVSVDVGDVKDRLAGVRGTRIVARDPNLLAQALFELLAPPQRSDGVKHVANLSSEYIAAQILDLYRRVIARSSGGTQDL